LGETSKGTTTNGNRIERLAAGLARIRVPLGFFAAGAVLYLAQPTQRSLAIGGAVALAGEMLRLWAAGHLDKGREVTQSGPYRFTRHPLYLGSAILAAGLAVASARISVAVIIGVYLAVVVGSAVRHEEENMRSRFGPEYDQYLLSQTGRVDRRFSLDRAMSINKEYKAVAGLVAVGVILAAKVALNGD
jgi:F0F1-type ATP synthase membrane subunit c/vacuolar-type H+-ATPase subunit K